MNGNFARLNHGDPHYPVDGMYHLKLALEKIALGEYENPLLVPYKARCVASPFIVAGDYVRAAAVYLLASAFADIRADIQSRFPDCGALDDDYIAINMAIPVADANNPNVSAIFESTLIDAWAISGTVSDPSQLGLRDLWDLLSGGCLDQDRRFAGACFIYPEVSANVQGYVRSKSSSPGIFLLSDAGAGSVDQSVFIFWRDEGRELLTYLHGSVLPLGSSRIDHVAAERAGIVTPATLEAWRSLKERGEHSPELESARNCIAAELGRGTRCTLAMAKKKLYYKDQLLDLRLIYTGGGHCEHPYATGVASQLDGQLFSAPIPRRVIGFPVPGDLELQDAQRRWMPRLSVAYGLSFHRHELTRFILPSELPNPTPEEIWQPRAATRIAPTKDEC